MTNKEIRQHRHILNEIPMLRNAIRELRGKIVVTHDTVKASQSGPPYTLHDVAVEVPEALTDVRDTLAIKRRRLRRIIQQRKAVEKYIDSIEDSYLRQVVTLRATTTLDWDEIAGKVNSDEKSVKNAYYRHFRYKKK